MCVSGSTVTDQAHSLQGLSIDEDQSNAWSSKCFAYSRSLGITCAPVTSGSFVRLEYGLYSKAYSRSFAESHVHTETVNELAALLGEIGSRGLHTLAPCSVRTSVVDLVPSYGVLAVNSAYTGSGESTVDNLVRDLKQANELLPRDQQCTIKSATVTLNIMSSKGLHPVRTTSSHDDDGERDSDCSSEYEQSYSENDESVLYNADGDRIERKQPEDALVESNQLFCGPGRFIGLTLGNLT